MKLGCQSAGSITWQSPIQTTSNRIVIADSVCWEMTHILISEMFDVNCIADKVGRYI